MSDVNDEAHCYFRLLHVSAHLVLMKSCSHTVCTVATTDFTDSLSVAYL